MLYLIWVPYTIDAADEQQAIDECVRRGILHGPADICHISAVEPAAQTDAVSDQID